MKLVDAIRVRQNFIMLKVIKENYGIIKPKNIATNKIYSLLEHMVWLTQGCVKSSLALR